MVKHFSQPILLVEKLAFIWIPLMLVLTVPDEAMEKAYELEGPSLRP